MVQHNSISPPLYQMFSSQKTESFISNKVSDILTTAQCLMNIFIKRHIVVPVDILLCDGQKYLAIGGYLHGRCTWPTPRPCLGACTHLLSAQRRWVPGGRVTNAVGTIYRKIFVGTRARPI